MPAVSDVGTALIELIGAAIPQVGEDAAIDPSCLAEIRATIDQHLDSEELPHAVRAVLLGAMLFARGTGSAAAVRALEATVHRPEVLAALDKLADAADTPIERGISVTAIRPVVT